MQGGGTNVKNLAAMFEKKATLKPEPKRGSGIKKDDIPAPVPSTNNVSNMAAMFEKKKTVNLDQDKKKFLTNNTAPLNSIANNPFVKNQNNNSLGTGATNKLESAKLQPPKKEEIKPKSPRPLSGNKKPVAPAISSSSNTNTTAPRPISANKPKPAAAQATDAKPMNPFEKAMAEKKAAAEAAKPMNPFEKAMAEKRAAAAAASASKP